MCDKGIIECDPSVMKLEYCVVITNGLQRQIEKKVSELTGEDCFISSPIQGKYPEDNPAGTNKVLIVTRKDPYTKFGPDKIIYNDVATFSLKELPGCCGVMVSYHTNIQKRYQGKGLGDFLLDIKERIARDNYYSLLMCTTISDNAVERHLLEKHGFISERMFTNKRTNNTVLMYSKILE